MALRFGVIACTLALVHLISTTAASTTAGDLFAIFDKEHEVLATVPSQCKAGCDTVSNMLDKICKPSECCTTTLQMEYFNCFTCIGSATNQTDYSQVQGDIDRFNIQAMFNSGLFLQCQARGVQLPRPQAFPGQSPNRMVPSTSALPLVAPSTLAPVPSVPATSTITPSTTATPTSGSMRIGAPNDAISSFGQFVVVGSLVVGGMLELI
ncbi:hypothetical protein BD779DRAFT_1472496 [Infundibulicybe gibba]|nr:hypothetical protein BD779DRAFT_1472496 [Infundibulicybe gibba]